MALHYDRVRETATTTGTGNFTLAGTSSGYIAFSAVYSNGDRVPYVIQHTSADEWETGLGTMSSGLLARTNVSKSSNSNNAVNFSSGTKNVFVDVTSQFINGITQPATQIVLGAGLNSALTSSSEFKYDTSTDTLTIGNDATIARSGANAITIASTLALSSTLAVTGAVTLTVPLAATSGGIGLTTATQGDILYASASNTYSKLAKDTNATRYLANTGSSNNPAWAQIALATGVSGDLPFANLTQGSALSVLGVTGNATADHASIAAGTDGNVLRRSGTALTFGTLDLTAAGTVGTSRLTAANFIQGSALSVLGVTGNATANFASIAAASDGQVLVRSGTSLAFGAVNLAAAAAVTGVLPAANQAPAGSTTQIQYNSSSAYAGSANLTFTGSQLGVGSSGAQTLIALGGQTATTIGTDFSGMFGTAAVTIAGTGAATLTLTPTSGNGTVRFYNANDGTNTGWLDLRMPVAGTQFRLVTGNAGTGTAPTSISLGARTVVNTTTDDGSNALQVNGNTKITGNLIHTGADVDQSLTVSASQSSAFSLTIGNGISKYVLLAAGTLTSGTLNLPSSANAVDGQTIRVFFTQITTCTVASSGATVNGASIAAVAANTSAAWIYKASSTTWYKF